MPSGDLTTKYDECLICGGKDWITVREGTDLCRPELAENFKLCRCRTCSHIMQIPIPDDQQLTDAYSVGSDYSSYKLAWKESGWPVWKILRTWTSKRRISRLNHYGDGRDLLEVGSGAGDFLVAANKAGWQARAVEYNHFMATTVRDELGFDVRAGELAPGLWQAGTFDAVAFWNVLEHLQNPLQELTIAAGYLRPSGKIFLNIPSRQAAENGQWFGKYWALLDIPRHINFFDEVALSRVCERAGLELAVYKTPFVQSAWCYYRSCWNWANRDKKKAGRWPRFLILSAGVTLLLPYVFVKAFGKRGMEAFAVVTKL